MQWHCKKMSSHVNILSCRNPGGEEELPEGLVNGVLCRSAAQEYRKHGTEESDVGLAKLKRHILSALCFVPICQVQRDNLVRF